MDAIYRDPITNATVYVGNQSAASELEHIQSHNISSVVNCTDNMPNFHETSKTAKVDYLRFPISFWSSSISSSSYLTEEQQIAKFLSPLLNFVDKSLAAGRSVLIHCLAGAHRAGTAGVIVLMHLSGTTDVQKAIETAKLCRPIIDPIGMLPVLIKMFAKAKEEGCFESLEGGGSGKGKAIAALRDGKEGKLERKISKEKEDETKR
jgi:protein tyrosine/serine phosphatase